MIKIENISYSYPGNNTQVLNNVSCEFRRGKVTAITGANGCGKTTLMKIVTGVLRPDSGSVMFCEKDGSAAVDIADKSLSEIGKLAGFVYQDPTRQLFCETVFDEIAYGLRERAGHEHGSNGGMDDITERVKSSMKYFRLEGRENDYPGTMSQGEKQRVMLAAITALDTEYVILDEPTSGLDSDGCQKLGELLRDMAARGIAVAIVSHEKTFIEKYADIEINMEQINIREPAHAPACKTDSEKKAPLIESLDTRSRMFASMCFVMASLFTENILMLLSILVIMGIILVAGGVGKVQTFNRIKAMLGLSVSIFLLQCIFDRKGNAVLTAGGFTLVTEHGLQMGAVVALRLLILTFTALLMISGSMRDCLAGLTKMHVPYEIVFMVMAALKFLPILKEESIDVMNAARMRGASFDSLSVTGRLKFYLKLAIPITAGAIRRAERMNIAMAARGFRTKPSRTSMYSVRMKKCDWVFMSVMLLLTVMLLIVF